MNNYIVSVTKEIIYGALLVTSSCNFDLDFDFVIFGYFGEEIIFSKEL